jgi:hypothetical protein
MRRDSSVFDVLTALIMGLAACSKNVEIASRPGSPAQTHAGSGGGGAAGGGTQPTLIVNGNPVNPASAGTSASAAGSPAARTADTNLNLELKIGFGSAVQACTTHWRIARSNITGSLFYYKSATNFGDALGMTVPGTGPMQQGIFRLRLGAATSLCETPSGAGEITRARDTTRVNAALRYVRSLRGKLPRSLPANAASAGCMCNARFALIGLLDAVSPLGKPLVRLLD